MNRSQELVELVECSLNPTNWTLPESVANIEGLVGPDFKRFLHSVVSSPIVKRYLEIGAWEGSSTVSAMYGNINKLDKHWVVDNWCEWFFHSSRNGKDGFTKNWNTHIQQPANLIDADSFSINPSDYGMSEIDVYFYDGGHTEEQQSKALTHYIHCMAPQFIYIVDDWNWEQVRRGSTSAMDKLGLKVVWSKSIAGNGPGLSTHGWANGTGIFVLDRTTVERQES